MRTKIALRNLYISQTIILLFLVFSYFAWFPHSFSILGGFYDTAWMLIFVDLVLGPLLVFIVYKEGKKYLKFDINVLLSIQLGAFVFGAYSLYLKHPTYAVFVKDRFTLINISHANPQKLSNHQLRPSMFSPRFVYAKMPEDIQERMDFMLGVDLRNEPTLEQRADFYEPLEAHKKTILRNGINIEHIIADQHGRQSLVKFITTHGGVPSDYAYFPLKGNNKKEVIWVFDRKSMKPMGIIDLELSKLIKTSAKFEKM